MLPNLSTSESASICQGESFKGFSTAGTFVQNLTALNGCDSTHTINITVLPDYDTTITATICAGGVLYGYTTTGLHIDTLTASNGCDSVRQVNLTVLPNFNTSENIKYLPG
ncbi:MAG: hypothetical protein U5L96_09525 [Owenweeksia sp.]|nr:hypothetical protein [Owenweeksia sp.]